MPESFQSKHQGIIRSAEMTLCSSESSIPPMQDTLLIGRKAAIGPAAAKQMVDALSPDEYEVISLDSPGSCFSQEAAPSSDPQGETPPDLIGGRRMPGRAKRNYSRPDCK
ncbi:MAG: hypothetical protein ACOYCE_04895 [Limnochordia bacterium]|jgi:hypothetical protein